MAETVNQRIALLNSKIYELERVIEYTTGLAKVRKQNEYDDLKEERRIQMDLRRVHSGSYILEADDGEASTTNFLSFP